MKDPKKSVAIWSAFCLTLFQGVSGQEEKTPQSVPALKGGQVIEMVQEFRLLSKLEGLTNHVYGLAFSLDGTRVAAGDTDGYAVVWSFPSGKRLASFSAALEEGEDVSIFHAMAFSHDGTLLFAGDDLGRVHIWDIRGKRRLKVIRAHGKKGDRKFRLAVDDLALSPDGTSLATCGSDGQVRLWSVPDGKAIKTIRKHRRAVEALAFTPDGQRLVVGDIDTRVLEISLKDGKVLAQHKPLKGDSMLGGLAVGRGGETVVSQGYHGRTRLLSRPGLKVKGALGPPEARDEDVDFRGNDLALHPAGRILAVAYRHSNADFGLVVLWDLKTEKELKRFEIFNTVADNVRFSPDGRYLIAAGAETWVAVFGQ
jgi:WD40 repeat protein